MVLSPDEVDELGRGRRNGRVVGMKKARRFLLQCIDRYHETQNSICLHDLTKTEDFDWKTWLCERPVDALEIVGPGIIKFSFVWITVLNERHGDFMVSRIDGKDIRLHPQQTKPNQATGLREVLPVWGSWEAGWNQHEALAVSQGQGGPCRFFPTFAKTHGKKEAIWFLKRWEAAWHAKWNPWDPYHPSRVGITEGVAAPSQRRFHWPYFVQRREWYRQHIEDEGMHIMKFEVVWSHRRRGDGIGQAVFLGMRSDGQWFTVNPRAGAAKEFSWLDDITEI